jgi:hypothetical protein
VDPKERARCLPIGEGVSIDAPCRGTLVMNTERNVVIDSWVGGSNPLSEVLAQFIPCKRGQAFLIRSEVTRSRTLYVGDLIDHLLDRYSGFLHA